MTGYLSNLSLKKGRFVIHLQNIGFAGQRVLSCAMVEWSLLLAIASSNFVIKRGKALSDVSRISALAAGWVLSGPFSVCNRP